MTKIYLAGAAVLAGGAKKFNVELARFSRKARASRSGCRKRNTSRATKPLGAIFEMGRWRQSNWADMVVACMDGPRSGQAATAWECGYALWPRGKPIVCYSHGFSASPAIPKGASLIT